MTWQPIETAPLTTKWVLVWVPSLNHVTMARYLKTQALDGWYKEDNLSYKGNRKITPSHWMPVPEAPK